MTSQQQGINQRQNPLEGYRGALVHRQEYSYKLITMLIDLHTLTSQAVRAVMCMISTFQKKLNISPQDHHRHCRPESLSGD